MIKSAVILEKPSPHVHQSDWNLNTSELQSNADSKRNAAFNLRHGSRQMRNETQARTEWNTYHVNNRLKERVTELEIWCMALEELVFLINKEKNALKEEKATAERDIEVLNKNLYVTAECLNTRDSRKAMELTYDMTDTEMKKELCILEINKKILGERVQLAWEKINKLENVSMELMLAINNKKETINIENNLLSLTKDCANITFKPDSCKIPRNEEAYSVWLERVQRLQRAAQDETRETLAMREGLSLARGRASADARAQADATDYALRRRLHETTRAVNELEWQKNKLEESMQRLMRELGVLEAALASRCSALKLAETRLVSRTHRPLEEVVTDEPGGALRAEARTLHKTISETKNKIDHVRTLYNDIEQHYLRIILDLENKVDAVEIDSRCLESRLVLRPLQEEDQAARSMELLNFRTKMMN